MKLKERLERLFKKAPNLAQDDYKLLALIWNYDLRKLGVDSKQLSTDDFLKLYVANKKMTNSESIRRMRQKIVQDTTELQNSKTDQIRQKLGIEFRNSFAGGSNPFDK